MQAQQFRCAFLIAFCQFEGALDDPPFKPPHFGHQIDALVETQIDDVSRERGL
jgi:hypothetical protein